MSSIEDQVQELLDALQLEPRKAWADELSIPVLAGRCAGSYGCGVRTNKTDLQKASEESAADIIGELSSLVASGVTVEHASAALARKYESEQTLYKGLTQLISVLRDPRATKEDFSKAIKGLITKGSRGNPQDIVDAIEKGHFDRL